MIPPKSTGHSSEHLTPLGDAFRGFVHYVSRSFRAPQSTIDVLIFLLIIVLLYLLGRSTDAFEHLIAWLEQIEYLEFDEIFIVMASTSILFGVFALRRLRETQWEINQRQQTEKALYQRNQELGSLYEATRAIGSDLDLETVLQTVAEKVTQVIHTDGCAISLWEPEKDALITLVDYSRLFPENTESQGTSYKVSEYPATQRVLETGQPLALDQQGPDIDPAELAYMVNKEISGLLLMPLVAHDEVIGLIEIYEELEERVYSQEEINLIQSLATHAAVTIEKARLFEDAQRRLQQTQALRAIDNAIIGSLDLQLTLEVFLEQVLTQLHVDAACVLVFDRPSRKLVYTAGQGFHTEALQHTRLPLGGGLAGVAALERRVIEIPDLGAELTNFSRSPHFTTEGFVSYYAVPLISNNKLRGVLEIFHRAPLYTTLDWLEFSQTLATQAAIAIDNASLFLDLQRSNLELSHAYESTLEGWSRALDLRDKETEGHTKRVVVLTIELARAMGVNEDQIEHIRRGALLHDIGKMGIADSILLKPGPLSDDEWKLMRRHPVYAYQMLYPIDYLRPALDIPYCHHEKWDGTGYPRGLEGDQIPLAARIFAIIDVYDALRSDRPYRKAWSEEKTLAYILEQSGNHFDPRVVTTFMDSMEDIHALYSHFSHDQRRTGFL